LAASNLVVHLHQHSCSDTNWCERVKNQRQGEEEEEQDQEDSSIAEEWVVLEDLRGRHAGPEEAPLNPMTMGQFFDVADLPPVYDQQLQAVLSRLPAALLYALSLSLSLSLSSCSRVVCC
jgi:hypothetical protein